MRIPGKFARKYGSEISSQVSLKVPSGALWKVGLTKCADGTWLHNGWAEFSKHYSLSYGSFLVFRYEGNGHFDVIIFDRSASEISYPCNGTHGSRVLNGGGFQDHAMEDNRDDLSIEILDDVPSSKKTRARSPSPLSRPHKTFNPNSKDNIPVEVLDEIPPPFKKTRVRSPSPRSQLYKTNNSTSTMKSSRVKCEIAEPQINVDSSKGCGNHPHQMKDSRRTKTLQRKERAKALLQANSFKSENPFFMVVMQPTYVHRRFELTIPKKFCMNYLSKRRGDIILSVCGKKARSIWFTHSLNSVPKLQHGWKEFVMENHLDVGDVCVFELINQAKITFNVVIFRSTQGAKSGPISAKDGGKYVPPRAPQSLKAGGRLKSFKSKNPFFGIEIRTTRMYSRVDVPYAFFEAHIEQDVVNLTLENGGKQWPVKVLLYVYSMRREAYLGHNWGAFVRDNNLQAGDGCAFELINKEDSELRAHIFRKSA